MRAPPARPHQYPAEDTPNVPTVLIHKSSIRLGEIADGYGLRRRGGGGRRFAADPPAEFLVAGLPPFPLGHLGRRPADLARLAPPLLLNDRHAPMCLRHVEEDGEAREALFVHLPEDDLYVVGRRKPDLIANNDLGLHEDAVRAIKDDPNFSGAPFLRDRPSPGNPEFVAPAPKSFSQRRAPHEPFALLLLELLLHLFAVLSQRGIVHLPFPMELLS